VSVLSAIILGIVQGFTEFLPVSSSGHLVLGQALLGISLTGITFEITVHLATLCAVLWVYRGRVASLAAGAVGGDRASWTYIGLLALASVPAGLVGWLARDWFESAFGRPVVAAALLLVTGFLVYSVRFTASRAKDPAPSVAQATWIGVAQAAAILPGISRSGATVAVGAWRGVQAVAVAEGDRNLWLSPRASRRRWWRVLRRYVCSSGCWRPERSTGLPGTAGAPARRTSWRLSFCPASGERWVRQICWTGRRPSKGRTRSRRPPWITYFWWRPDEQENDDGLGRAPARRSAEALGSGVGISVW